MDAKNDPRITRLGMLAHQISYLAKMTDGPSNTFRTYAAAAKWLAKMDAAIHIDAAQRVLNEFSDRMSGAI